MKFLQLLMVAFLATAVISCSTSPTGDAAETGDATDTAEASAEAKTYTVDATSSTINWEGTKPGGSHAGTIGLKSGSLSVKDGNIEAGEFVLDMTSIQCTDEGLPDDMKAKLAGHLASDAFFDVTNHPEAKFVLASASPIEGTEGMTHSLTGNLMMKDSTRSVTFNAAVDITENGVAAESNNFKINRTEWAVNHGSTSVFKDLKDGIVNDEIGLKVKLVAN